MHQSVATLVGGRVDRPRQLGKCDDVANVCAAAGSASRGADRGGGNAASGADFSHHSSAQRRARGSCVISEGAGTAGFLESLEAYGVGMEGRSCVLTGRRSAACVEACSGLAGQRTTQDRISMMTTLSAFAPLCD